MDQGGTAEKIFESKPERSRRELEDVEEYLRDRKVKIWRQKSVDKEERASVINLLKPSI